MSKALHLRQAGSGPPLLFLHGWTMTGAAFEGQFQRLSGQFHCLAPDLPGHGGSDGPANIATAVERLLDLLHDQDLQEVTVIGWSLGAMIAWHLIDADKDRRIVRMVSEDMSPRPRQTPDWPHGIRNDRPGRMSRRICDDWPGTARAISHGMFADRGGSPDMSAAEAEAMILAQNPDAMAHFWSDLMAADARGIVASMKVPLLAIFGTHSRVYLPDVAAWLGENAPRCRTMAFPASGHSPHLEEPDRFAEAIRSFAKP
ncbi:hypothetical protein ACMU_12120 [Actibacterium mucosum KCTC 23349]|uniref:AB hydrolase-1 domain-containing protein n=1 Tax=Actibacterium mucosum KCTC 23349 TaxID=1454373 RepID=A0A037ZKW3_9RHOB|nr:alpha/beta hydrolase [Actibacterium mucosum]KAJ55436.1 hypothetical protein ACMU_12120 [Actibacterium mucosum KCTC 23349]